MRTPWGAIQQRETPVRGLPVTIVMTAGHGGWMVARKWAEENLTAAAVALGDPCGDYMAYEEDCNFAIPAWELESHWAKLFGNWYIKEGHEGVRESLRRTLSSYNGEYLIGRGDAVEPELYARDQAFKEHQRRVAERDPDAIVNYITNNSKEGWIKVRTADGLLYYITIESYRALPTLGVRLLSNCQRIATPQSEQPTTIFRGVVGVYMI